MLVSIVKDGLMTLLQEKEGGKRVTQVSALRKGPLGFLHGSNRHEREALEDKETFVHATLPPQLPIRCVRDMAR